MKKKMIGLALSLILAAGTLTGCGGGNDSQTSASGESSGSVTAENSTTKRENVIVGYHMEPATLDPNNMSDGAAFTTTIQIYEGLVWINDDLEIEPRLAKSWEVSDDGMTYTFHLEEGVTFHNGEPLTAEDVKYSYQRAIDGKYATAVTDIIDTMEAVDEHTFQVVLKYPYSPALECFAAPQLRIVSKKAVEECGDSFSYKPVDAGTGPYRFVSWDSGNNMIMEAYEEYWRGEADIKDVEIRFLTDQTTLSSALEAGDVDAGTIVVSDVLNYEDNDAMSYDAISSLVFNFVGFNTQMEPFDNELVRQAVAYSCDTDELIISAFDSEVGATRTATVVPPAGLGYNEELETYPKDVEKAKELLAEAGYPDGFETTLYTPNNTQRKNIATYLQACLAEIGITANIEIMEQAAVLEEIRAGNCPIFIMGYSGFGSDADIFMYNNFYTGTDYNYSKYSNTELDEILDQARQSSDPEKRESLYKEASEIIYEEVPVMPTYFQNQLWGYTSDLNSGILPTGSFYIYDWSWK